MEYIKAKGIWYKNEINTIKKHSDPLQPVYEAFINSWESIIEKYPKDKLQQGKIIVAFYVKSSMFSPENKEYDFDKIIITDNGIGLTDKSYERLINLRDDRKHYSNKGTGRIQFLHFFDETIINSIYENEKKQKLKRKVTLSKKECFLNQNAILRLDEEKNADDVEVSTSTILSMPLNDKDGSMYATIPSECVKKELISHFISKFCDNRNQLPTIMIERFIDEKEVNDLQIKINDIPTPNKEIQFKIHYSKLNEQNKVIHSDRTEIFTLKSFVASTDIISKNEIYLVSNGEKASKIPLYNILENEPLDGEHYLFLLSGKYIDDNDSDTRGNINLIHTAQFKEQNSGGNLFPEEAILLEDIKDETNQLIVQIYPKIAKRHEEKQKKIEELREIFLLNPKTIETLKNKIKNTDSDADILQKVYKSDAEIKAQKDAKIKQQVKDIEELLPTNKDYKEKLKEKVNLLVQDIPLQNRTELAQYVARRKLVLNIFDKILNKELEDLRNGKRIDEDILHNLIFQQSSKDPVDSDLWLINEEYIYFKGTSNHKLYDITIDGETLLKNNEELTEEERAYKMKCNKDAGNRQPDILLFPKEGKCIIIEFKAPMVDVADHLLQINRYARLINNLSQDKFNIQTYYGYLIGENIDIDEIQDSDPNFKSAASLNYIFRPYLPINGKFGRKDGSLYTEIIKYSDLLKRAKLRNKIFIDKLDKDIHK